MTRCLIVGGGFLGAHLAEYLSWRGHDVAIFSRSFNEWLVRQNRGGPGAIRLIEGEVPPGRGLSELIEQADIVFYLAGTSTPAMASSDPGGSIMRYVVPAAAVLDQMRETSTRRVVIASSGGTVYGIVKRLPTDEKHPTRPISLHGHHSLTIERYAQFFAKRYGFEAVILRYANPFGPGQLARRGQAVIAAWSQALARGEPIVIYGDPQTRRDFVYVDDLSAATAEAAFRAPPGVYNVGSGRATTLLEVIELLQRAAGRRVEVVQADPRPVDVPVTQLDFSRLESLTGWRPSVALADGIRATWQWASTLPYERDA